MMSAEQCSSVGFQSHSQKRNTVEMGVNQGLIVGRRRVTRYGKRQAFVLRIVHRLTDALSLVWFRVGLLCVCVVSHMRNIATAFPLPIQTQVATNNTAVAAPLRSRAVEAYLVQQRRLL